MKQRTEGIPVQTAAGCPCLAAVPASAAHWTSSTGHLPLEPAPDSAAVPCTTGGHTCIGSKQGSSEHLTPCAQLSLYAHPHDEQVGGLCYRLTQRPNSLLTLWMRLHLLLTKQVKGRTAELLRITYHAGCVGKHDVNTTALS